MTAHAFWDRSEHTDTLPDEQPPEPEAYMPEQEPPAADADHEALRQIRFHERVSSRAEELRISEAARRQIARENRADKPTPHPQTLTDFLAQPDEDAAYRIDELWPIGGRVLMPSQFKAGKTTMVANVLRSLADGKPFLDRFTVAPAGSIVLIDDELDPRTLRRWLRDQGIENTGAVQVVSLRGNVASFDLLDDDARAEWATRLAGADVVVVDCLRPILDALGLDENHEAGRFLVALDALLADLGNADALLVHHMGHGPERSRGDSRLNDWPDAIWKLVRDKDEEDESLDDLAGSRYFSAFGRDVDLAQSELTYDPLTRRLTLGTAAPNRKQATAKRNARKADEAVMKAVVESPGITSRRLRDACRELGATHNQDIDDAVERMVEQGLIWRQKQGAARLHWPSTGTSNRDESDSVPSVPSRAQNDLGTRQVLPPGVNVPKGTPGLGTHTREPETLPGTTSDPPDLGTTKPCPDCGLVEIPDHHRRCDQCTQRIVKRVAEERQR